MKRAFVFVASAVAFATTSVDAGVLGFSSFAYTASNGNIVIDVFAVMSNASDRLLRIYDANLTTTQGGSTPSTYVQPAGTASASVWEPVFSSTRSNTVDSFLTFGVDGGGPYGGEYYASAVIITFPPNPNPFPPNGNQVLLNVAWGGLSPLLDNVAESMSVMTGTRTDSSAAAAGSNLGVWCAHLVIASGDFGARWWNATAAAKDGVTGATNTNTGTMQMYPVPAPGVLALLGVAGFASRRRRK